MTNEPESPTLHDRAREWGRALLDAAPWSGVSDRVTLLLVEPPSRIEEPPAAGMAFWLTLDREAARSLPPAYRDALGTDRAVVERPRVAAGVPPVTLSVMTDEGLHRLLQAVTRPALEARWQARHLEAISDRLRRAEQYELRAGLLPEDVPERVVRTLWLDLVAALRALSPAPGAGGLPVAGEAAAALCRLACFEAVGGYPPAHLLRAVARDTRLGRRLGPWLDDLASAIGSDEAAARRVISSRDQVAEVVRTVLGELYRNRPWLRDPEAFMLQAPR